jgi:hypothetical protein
MQAEGALGNFLCGADQELAAYIHNPLTFTHLAQEINWQKHFQVRSRPALQVFGSELDTSPRLIGPPDRGRARDGR